MTDEEYDSLREWQHTFANRFFDLFVAYELDKMHERIIPEGEIYSIAYDNSVAASIGFENKDPIETAEEVFEDLKK